MNKVILVPLFALILILIDFYVFQGLKTAIQSFKDQTQWVIKCIYWFITVGSITGLFWYHFGNPDHWVKFSKSFIMLGLFTNYLAKSLWIIVLVIEDLTRVGLYAYYKLQELFQPTSENLPSKSIPRSEFLAKAGFLAASVPVVAVGWGVISGAHDYRIRRRTIQLPHLPAGFEGIRIAQISDIHSGSFWSKRAVEKGVEKLTNEKADMVFFTGDLVNNRASEMKDYLDVFSKIKAPLGVYSTLGNHDYGDYVFWPSQEVKRNNLNDLKQVHSLLGWQLLMNENRIVEVGGDQVAILGVENWSAKPRFPKYGNLLAAYQGTESVPVKLLLSHDPSHWKAEVISSYPDIDVTFSGHTHGMQFGIEIAGYKWSPIKYIYSEWADLYQSNNQYLYVNRGFGYLGFPARIGIPPEITIFTLTRKA